MKFEILGCDDSSFAEMQGAQNGVLQFAHVAWPGVLVAHVGLGYKFGFADMAYMGIAFPNGGFVAAGSGQGRRIC